MSYQEFKSEYFKLLKESFNYNTDQVGSGYFISKISDLLETVPAEWEEKADEEFA